MFPCSWEVGLDTDNFIYTFSIVQIKIPARYFVVINKLILKFKWEVKRSRIASSVWKKNRELTLLNSKTYYKAIVVKTA